VNTERSAVLHHHAPGAGGIARLAQQRPRLVRVEVEGVLPDPVPVPPDRRRDRAQHGHGQAFERDARHLVGVDRVADRPAYPHVGDLLDVESQVGAGGSRHLHIGEPAFPNHPAGVARGCAGHDVDVAPLEGDHPRRLVWDDADDQLVEVGSAPVPEVGGAPRIVGIALVDDPVVGNPLPEPERPRAHGRGPVVGTQPLDRRWREHRQEVDPQRREDRRIGPGEHQAHRVIVYYFSSTQRADPRRTRRVQFAAGQPVEGGLHSGCGEGGTVVEPDVALEPERDHGAVARDLPRLRQGWRELSRAPVHPDQRVVHDEVRDPHRWRPMGIERRGIGTDHQGQRPAPLRRRRGYDTGSQQDRQHQGQCGMGAVHRPSSPRGLSSGVVDRYRNDRYKMRDRSSAAATAAARPAHHQRRLRRMLGEPGR
jgi:hypothetical protein